jgi:isoquinoline 1-oxidoreductase beta subunit
MLERRDFLTVLNKLEEVSNWKQKLPSGRGRGVAITLNHGSVVGHVAEVTVDNQNRVKVDKVFVAVDC